MNSELDVWIHSPENQSLEQGRRCQLQAPLRGAVLRCGDRSSVELELELGLRPADPLTGKYIESDTFGLKGGLNGYTYVGANPLTRRDPRGLDYWVQNGGVTEQRGLHQAVCVGQPGAHPFCISFAAYRGSLRFDQTKRTIIAKIRWSFGANSVQ
jgi:RHS repeat-associated protein